jgi:hypothetical protein
MSLLFLFSNSYVLAAKGAPEESVKISKKIIEINKKSLRDIASVKEEVNEKEEVEQNVEPSFWALPQDNN